MTTTVKPEDAEREAAAAAAAIEAAEAEIARGERGSSADKLHALRDKFRHATLSADGLRARAERERMAARLAGLAEIGQQVDALAASAPGEMPEALRAIADASARVRQLAAAHDGAVSDLVAAARDLGAERAAPGGPRGTSSYVAVKGDAIVHRRTQVSPVGAVVAQAIGHALSGALDDALGSLSAVTEQPEPLRPDHLRRGANGVIIAVSGSLDPGAGAAQLRQRHRTVRGRR